MNQKPNNKFKKSLVSYNYNKKAIIETAVCFNNGTYTHSPHAPVLQSQQGRSLPVNGYEKMR